MTFGVPVEALPVTYEGELKTGSHLKWLSRRLAKETQIQKTGRFSGIDLPGIKDVLLGRGKPVQDHRGNILMRTLVSTFLDQYKSALKRDKILVASKVVVETKRCGGRFLKRSSDGWWSEVSDEAARDKVSMTFRTTISSKASNDPSRRLAKLENGKRPRIQECPSPCFAVPCIGISREALLLEQTMQQY
jgi:hypothetical protein